MTHWKNFEEKLGLDYKVTTYHPDDTVLIQELMDELSEIIFYLES